MSQRTQLLLDAARKLEVAEPPPLEAIRGEAGARARRAAQWVAFAVAIPLGAAAAAGGWAVHERVVRPPPARERALREPGGAVHTEAQTHAASGPASAVAEAPSAADALPVPDRFVQPTVPRAAAARVALASPDGAAPTTGVAPASSTAASRVALPSLGGTAQTTGGAHASGAAAEPDAPAASAPLVARASSPSETPRSAVKPPAPTTLSDEAALLSETLTALRGRHDAQAALDAVARYRVRFPDGVLASEMTLAAAEAHRSAGHTAQALTELEQLSGDPLHGELSVLRAELRAELGRCGAARLDLAASLDTLPDALRRRALFTDASCAATLGARDEAVARLNTLLALDPTDARARALMEQLK